MASVQRDIGWVTEQLPAGPRARLLSGDPDEELLTCVTGFLVDVMWWLDTCSVTSLLAPSPPLVVPVIALLCVCLPLLAAWELPLAISVLRSARAQPGLDRRALTRFRRELDWLPETDHPLGD